MAIQSEPRRELERGWPTPRLGSTGALHSRRGCPGRRSAGTRNFVPLRLPIASRLLLAELLQQRARELVLARALASAHREESNFALRLDVLRVELHGAC